MSFVVLALSPSESFTVSRTVYFLQLPPQSGNEEGSKTCAPSGPDMWLRLFPVVAHVPEAGSS